MLKPLGTISREQAEGWPPVNPEDAVGAQGQKVTLLPAFLTLANEVQRPGEMGNRERGSSRCMWDSVLVTWVVPFWPYLKGKYLWILPRTNCTQILDWSRIIYQPLKGVHVSMSYARLHLVLPTSDLRTLLPHPPFSISLLSRPSLPFPRSLHEESSSHSPFRLVLEFLFLLTLEIPLADPAFAHPALCPALPSYLPCLVFSTLFLWNIPQTCFLPLSLMLITSKFFHLTLLVLIC